MPSVRDLNAPREVFDYDSLDAATSQFVQQQTGEIRALMKRTAQDIIEVGQRLIEVKKQLGHGRFGVWLEAEFDWTWKSATRFMNVADKFKFDNLSNLNFDPSALYELSAPSTPEPARTEAIARASAGEPITYSTAKAIRNKHTATRSKSKPPVKKTSETVVSPQSESVLQPVVSQPEPESISQPERELILEHKLQPQQSQLPSASSLPLKFAKDSRIVSIIPKSDITIKSTPPQVAPTLAVQQVVASQKREPGTWWRFDGKHLLYCGDLYDPNFLKKIPERIPLLIGFPLPLGGGQQSPFLADTYFSTILCYPNEAGSEGRTIKYTYELLENYILACSKMHDIVVSCFVPSPEILTLISNTKRLGILVEPNEGRCKAIVNDWKEARLKVQQLEKL